MSLRILLTLCLSIFAIVQSNISVNYRGVSSAEKHFYQPQAEFTCRFTGSKIPFNQVNDNYCDCSDGSDEPGTSACSNGQFFCRNRPFEPKFIPSSQVNDGTCDCCDGSDEYLSGKCANNCKELASHSISQKQEELRNYKLGVEVKKSYITLAEQIFQEKSQTKARLQNEIQEQEKQIETLRGLKEQAEQAEREEFMRETEEAEKKKKEQEQQAQEQQAQEQQAQATEQTEEKQEKEPEQEDKGQDLEDHLQEHAEEIGNFQAPGVPSEWEDDEDEDEEIKATDEDTGKELSEIGKKAKEARDALKTAEQQLSSKQNEINEIEKLLGADYGSQREFLPLRGKCYNLQTSEYNWELCPFDNAKQAGTSLGRFSGWESGHDVMKFTDGASCWGGPKRSLTVNVKCGSEEKVLNVHEPSKCTYEMDFATPAACDSQHLLALELNLQEFYSEDGDEE